MWFLQLLVGVLIGLCILELINSVLKNKQDFKKLSVTVSNLRSRIRRVDLNRKISRRIGKDILYSCVAHINLLEKQDNFIYKFFRKELNDLKIEAYDKLRIIKSLEDE